VGLEQFDEESSVVAPTNIPANSETTDDEDEPRQPKMRSLQDLYDSTNEVHLVCLLVDAENISFEETVRDKKWQTAMNEEIKAIDRNNTWELAELPKGSQPIGVKWVFKKKMNAQCEIEQYKVRLIAKGYKQKI
jgi:Reverse transcriptase (RNA-dependent DNA polymerase)